MSASVAWPALPFAPWRETCETLHMWTQIVGKVRLALAPPVNHWWHVPFAVNARGLTTSLITLEDGRGMEMRFDFVDHALVLDTTAGARWTLALEPRPVASFYRELVAVLDDAGVDVAIWTEPQEIPDRVRFEVDEKHASYDREHVERFFDVLVRVAGVFERFRSGFLGKCSPLQFFWGSFDLAMTRFSGRSAPEHGPVPNIALSVVREAYSHEVASAGFWPGSSQLPDPIFFAYAYPEPPGFAEAAIAPPDAYFHEALRERVLPYEAARTARSPEAAIRAFLESSYDAAATLGNWDRAALERAEEPTDSGRAPPHRGSVPRRSRRGTGRPFPRRSPAASLRPRSRG